MIAVIITILLSHCKHTTHSTVDSGAIGAGIDIEPWGNHGMEMIWVMRKRMMMSTVMSL